MSEHGTAPALGPGPTATITCLDNPPRLAVAPDPLRVNQDKGETATWECDCAPGFRIKFRDKTPFDRVEYDHTNAKNLSPSAGCRHGELFKYTITVDGYPPLDPNVIVDP